jgi:hypothetical protein
MILWETCEDAIYQRKKEKGRRKKERRRGDRDQENRALPGRDR